MWEQERPVLRSLPPFAYDCCATTSARLNGYSMVDYETNRYSVPVNRARQDVIVKAYPFHIDILDGTTLLARHPRSYEREQDLFEPLHYLPLLEQRPGAFDYARPMRQWRKAGRRATTRCCGVCARNGQKADVGCRSLFGCCAYMRTIRLTWCNRPLNKRSPTAVLIWMGCCIACSTSPSSRRVPELDLTDHPHLQAIGNQPIDLRQYEQLLRSSG